MVGEIQLSVSELLRDFKRLVEGSYSKSGTIFGTISWPAWKRGVKVNKGSCQGWRNSHHKFLNIKSSIALFNIAKISISVETGVKNNIVFLHVYFALHSHFAHKLIYIILF